MPRPYMPRTRLTGTTEANSINKWFGGGFAAIIGDYESISTVTAAGGETSLSLTSIPSTFTNLQIRGISHDTHTSGVPRSVLLRFNSDTGTNYARHFLAGDGAAASAGAVATTTFMLLRGCAPDDGVSASIFGAIDVSILDYANTSKYKTMRGFVGADQNGSGQVSIVSGLWQNTAAITSIQLVAEAVAFKAGSTFALYGIRGAV